MYLIKLVGLCALAGYGTITSRAVPIVRFVLFPEAIHYTGTAVRTRKAKGEDEATIYAIGMLLPGSPAFPIEGTHCTIVTVTVAPVGIIRNLIRRTVTAAV
jgi:hypothetical protein